MAFKRIKKKRRKIIKKPTFNRAITKFVIHMKILESSYKFIDAIAKTRVMESIKLMESVSEKIRKGSKKKFRVKPQNIPKFNSYQDIFINSWFATILIPKSLFVSMVSQFDTFLYDLMGAIYEAKPEILKASEKAIRPGLILKFKRIKSAITYLIKKQIEDVLRESHLYHIKWLENTLNIPLTKELGGLDKYIEITERRNLFVHCDGVVNEQYLSVCKKNSALFDSKLKEGDKLFVNGKYFFESYNYLYQLAVLMTEVIWRKLMPQESKKIESFIHYSTYELLRGGKYDLVIKILEYNLKLKSFVNKELFLMSLINLSLAYKYSGNKKKATDILNSQNWNTKNNKFQLAVLVIQEKYSEVVKLMKRIDKKEIRAEEYQEWPLFKDFRKTRYFLSAYRKIFKKKFILEETESGIKRKVSITIA